MIGALEMVAMVFLLLLFGLAFVGIVFWCVTAVRNLVPPRDDEERGRCG